MKKTLLLVLALALSMTLFSCKKDIYKYDNHESYLFQWHTTNNIMELKVKSHTKFVNPLNLTTIFFPDVEYICEKLFPDNEYQIKYTVKIPAGVTRIDIKWKKINGEEIPIYFTISDKILNTTR